MPLPDPARYAMDAAAAIGAAYADMDEGRGYLFRISKSGRSVVAGAGGISSFPVNSATAFTLSRDKAHTKAVLRSVGLPVIDGGLFFSHRLRASLRGPGREVDDARTFAAQLGYPVFAKPNHGSRGNFAEIVASDDALQEYARRIAGEFESFLIEPVMRGAEHRVLVHDGAVVFHALKQAPALVGDGRRRASDLLNDLNADLEGAGVSPWPASVLDIAGRDPSSVPAKGERIPLPGRRNLSTIGEIESFSDTAPPALAGIATMAVAALGLRIGAVDLFDLSPRGDLGQPVIIEVNGNPGLKTLELAGRSDLIRKLWIAMLSELLET